MTALEDLLEDALGELGNVGDVLGLLGDGLGFRGDVFVHEEGDVDPVVAGCVSAVE